MLSGRAMLVAFTPAEIERFKTDKAFATEYRVTLENIMNVRLSSVP